jgi:hypothetical protein
MMGSRSHFPGAVCPDPDCAHNLGAANRGVLTSKALHYFDDEGRVRCLAVSCRRKAKGGQIGAIGRACRVYLSEGEP